jgi:hypothetical protein
MADIHGSPGDAPQMPAAPGAGPAPVPYGGADQGPEPPVYGPPGFADAGGATHWVVADYPAGNGLQESAVAHDMNAGPPDAPYYPGTLSPVNAMGDADAGGRDDVAATVAQAVANAEARWHEFEGDTLQQGSTYGDLMDLPHSQVDLPAAGGPSLPPFETPYFPETNP